jgi:hypothetical protein
MNTFQLAEATWIDHGKDGAINTHEDETRQKLAYLVLLLIMVNIKKIVEPRPISSQSG